ncbi:MAG: hypothetical protein LBJ31_08900 [Treponema sp.]|jgi:hypothetical protein|nr:hypothetical protein [Treponema sp.]
METNKEAAPEARKNEKPGRGKRNIKRVILVFLVIFAGIPLAAELAFFAVRTPSGAVIPDDFSVYIHAKNPLTLIDHALTHESLPNALSNPALAALASPLNQLKKSDLVNNRVLRFMLRGSFSAALLRDNSFITAWDSAFAAPALLFLPLVSGSLKIPGLEYVRESRRFEYHAENASYYIAFRRNLIIAASSESLLNEALGEDGASYSPGKSLKLKNFDLSALLSSRTVTGILGEGNPLLASAFKQMELPEHIEMGLEIKPSLINVSLVAEVGTDNERFKTILERNSIPPDLLNMAPDTTQYLTGLGAASFEDLLKAVTVVNPELQATIDTADKASSSLLHLSVDDLLYSWTGSEFGVMGLEERASPVFAIKIEDELQRTRIFDSAFDTIFLRENTQTIIDGSRIPQIQIPPFIEAILRIIKVQIPSPYYTVYEGWMLVSESPENILTVVEGARKKTLLAKTDTWRELSAAAADNSALTLFYSLDRSIPFFLRGQSAASEILRMYRKGLLRVSLKDGVLTLNLSARSGAGRGLESVSGYPIALGGRTGSEVYVVKAGGEARLLLTRLNQAIAVNPADHKIYALDSNDPVWVIPANGLAPKTMIESAVAWVVSEKGLVTLVNGNMEAVEGFPVITGLKISAAPASHGGRVYLASEEIEQKGALYTVDTLGKIESLGGDYGAPILSPPSFAGAGKNARMAFYPKSFLGELFLANEAGAVFGGWPVYASGIAYGSPLVFTRSSSVNIAFVTMAGELSVFDESGTAVEGFPLALDGVFYVQPCWDGEYLWLVSEIGRLFRVSIFGSVLEQQIPDLRVKEEGFIAAADSDGDEISEVFISGEGNALYGYSRNLNSLEGFPLPVWGRPVLDDLDGDDRIDLAGVGMDNKLYRWKFKKGEQQNEP